jgi:hypothetical protein
VFEVDDYNDAIPGKRFEGSNNDGKPLASGTYFYEIQLPENVGGRKVIRGYIVLKQ